MGILVYAQTVGYKEIKMDNLDYALICLFSVNFVIALCNLSIKLSKGKYQWADSGAFLGWLCALLFALVYYSEW